MVIDFHAHVYPDKIASKAVDNIGEFYRLSMYGKGTVQDLLESGRRGGIDRFIVFSAAAVPGQTGRINEYIASVCGEHSECTGFGTLHPDLPDPGEEVERIISLGLKGVKFHPDMQKFNIDDHRMMRIYSLLEGKLPVIFHTGDYRYSYSHPARLRAVLDKYPKLVAVAAHFGGWSVYGVALENLCDSCCCFDISSSLPYLGKKRAAELIRIYGVRRFLFGSDYPMWDPGQCLREFLDLDLTDNEKESILYKNALEILKEGEHT
ncbi:MAG: amidohydrolase [Treponema sp.]|jgi:predicted TIM-barrel fold metal-dependent hydrolase|nr:amidohydrolase [Treponema sp.]